MVNLQAILNEAMKHVSDVMDCGNGMLLANEIDELTERFLRTFYPNEYKEFFK